MTIPEWKNWGGTSGPRKKSVGQHKCLSCMVIFRCNEDWFAMINPIKPNKGLWISPGRCQKVFKSFKILLAESYLLYLSIKRTWTWNSAQNWGAMAHPGPPFEPPLGNTRTKHNQLPASIWNFYYDAKKLLQADNCIMITSNLSDSLVKPKLFARVVGVTVKCIILFGLWAIIPFPL